jgi:hypothetical protein
MERIENDSPRQPVWKPGVRVLLDGKPIGLSQAVTVPGHLVPDRRCICGAKPNNAGELPCDH